MDEDGEAALVLLESAGKGFAIAGLGLFQQRKSGGRNVHDSRTSYNYRAATPHFPASHAKITGNGLGIRGRITQLNPNYYVTYPRPYRFTRQRQAARDSGA